MDAAFMSFKLHGSGNHAVRVMALAGVAGDPGHSASDVLVT
jgi:hypothetical protein